jgi:RNA polymerase sigma-70 factor (ECF subfamily)
MSQRDHRSSLDRWRAGNEGAARELFDCYAEKLVALARRRISQRLAGRVDPEDIVQSVFRTFFQRVQEGRFDFADPDDLGKLLVRITVHKTLRQVAFHKAAKRNPNLEVGQGQEAQQSWEEVLDAEPSPEEAVAFLDELESFLNRLRPQDRQILELRLQGWSNDEICEKLNIYDRKIRRVIERIRGLAEQEGLVPG